MFNEGRWNSDTALIYLCIFFLPTVLYFFMGFIHRVADLFDKQREIVYIDKPIYVDRVRYVEKLVHKPVKTQTKQVRKSQAKPVKQKTQPAIQTIQPVTSVQKAVKQSPKTSSSLIEDAISALVNTGFKKTQAKNIVNGLCANKVYTDLNQLIMEAFSRK